MGFGVVVEMMNRLTGESIVWSSEFRVVVELGNCLTGKLRGWWLFGVRGSGFDLCRRQMLISGSCSLITDY